ncbi:MAG: hypothetical protein II859_07505 [Bacteroidales bacterium]|nr:hypothetical protein [Bacteroidales bacterium]
MRRMETIIKKLNNQLLLLTCYLVILKAFGWLTKGWLFALAPLLIVAAARLAAFAILFTQYIIDRHGKKTGNQ